MAEDTARAGGDVGIDQPEGHNPWPGLWALVIGFFMILVDSTIVTVATPDIMRGLQADVGAVIWVTSAYLLAYAVPLLVTGRLGDRFGPKDVYLVGLALFTLSSLWCGLTGSIGWLVTARVVQGLGAALMTPQTMAVITRTFPATSRGAAMSLWGATAGVAMLVGPVLGGVLVDGPGWQWIFFINVPVGVIAFALAWRLVPRLTRHNHSFDWIGVALSAVGMFLLVFGIQEGQKYEWGAGIWALIVGGIVVLVAFIWWQRRVEPEPLLPLDLFRDRNFSLSNIAISALGFAITAFAFPFMLYAQIVHGYTPTQSGLLLVPMAVVTAVLARFVGTLVDRVHPRILVGFGFLAATVALLLLALTSTPDSSLWVTLVAVALFGLGNAFLWAPLGATATRNLPMNAAGAGSGVYNTTRQVGGVLGSAAIAALIENRLSANLGGLAGGMSTDQFETSNAALPPPVAEAFSTAMSQSMLLPAVLLVIGLVVSQFFVRPAFMAERVPS